MSRISAVIAAICISVSPLCHADSDVSMGIYLGVEPVVIYETPPPLVWMPELGVYIAYGSPYRLFFYTGEYYLYDYERHGWFAARGYGGPWISIEIRRLPRHLRRFRDEEWPRYQRRAETYYRKGYRHEHPYFPAWRERRSEDSDGHGRGPGRGRD